MNVRLIFLFLFVSLIGFSLRAENEGKIQILLLGDSTTEGSIPRLLQPEGPHLETVMEELLAAKGGIPPCRVINSSQSGEYIRRLLDSGRYQSNGADHPGVDYIFIRYGINDRARLEDFTKQFPADFHELIGILRKDHPDARIIPTTVIPFSNEEASREMNDLIREVAGKENLEVFDLYPRYAEALKQGPNLLNYRRYPVENIPGEFQEFVKSRVHGGKVVIMDNEWDALFGHLPGWYGDRHPNLAGYNVIAAATVDYLVPILRQMEESKVNVALVGDSTVTDSAGWGKAFAERFGPNVRVRNFAAGGRSARSWLAEGRLEEVLKFSPDYVFIQFGHNGQPGKGPERETDPATTYPEFLGTYLDAFREAGAVPVLVSSLTRREFGPDGKIRTEWKEGQEGSRPLKPWALAAEQLAVDSEVPFVDLYRRSVELHNEMGEEASWSFSPKEGDITHLNEEGARVIAGLVAEECRKKLPALEPFWKKLPPE